MEKNSRKRLKSVGNDPKLCGNMIFDHLVAPDQRKAHTTWGGHIVHRYIDNCSWLLGIYLKWAHISWLCFFQHYVGPVKAILQKKILKFWKIEIKRFLPRPKAAKNRKNCESWVFFQIHIFPSWIWVLYILSFLVCLFVCLGGRQGEADELNCNPLQRESI